MNKNNQVSEKEIVFNGTNEKKIGDVVNKNKMRFYGSSYFDNKKINDVKNNIDKT